MPTCQRLVPSRPLGRAALNELVGGIEDWEALRDLLSQLISMIPPIIEEEATGAMKWSVPRKCVPEMGELSSNAGLAGADGDVMVLGHCYCTDEENSTENEFLAFHLGFATEVPPEPPATAPTWSVERKVALVPLTEWPPGTCCKIPSYIIGCDPLGSSREALFSGAGDAISSHAEWTDAGDVWGNAPELAENLNSFVDAVNDRVSALATGLLDLQTAFGTFINDFANCTHWASGAHGQFCGV